MSSNLTTLQYELMKLLSSVTNQGTSAEAMKNAAGTVTPTSVRAAATIITMLPIICIYPFLQKYFVAGLTLGGVKEIKIGERANGRSISDWNLSKCIERVRL